MSDFQSVFDTAAQTEEEFDAIFGGNEDGELIDACCGFSESGECETDFDEIHQEPGDSDPDDMANDLRVDDETDNAPTNAEGKDTDPAIDLAMGESADSEFSDTGVKGSTDADDFYDDYNEPEEQSATTGEGPDVNPDNENIEDEFDKMVESVMGEGCNGGSCDGKIKEGGEEDLAPEEVDNDKTEISDDMDATMESLIGDYEEPALTKESDGYEEGDSDLVDFVIGNGPAE